jgi:hypothetical protein
VGLGEQAAARQRRDGLLGAWRGAMQAENVAADKVLA